MESLNVLLLCLAVVSAAAFLIPDKACAADASPLEGLNIVPLWPDGAPGALGTAEADVPVLAVMPAPEATATGVGVIVCPGGGYGHLAIDYEGVEVGEWLIRHGISAFVLRYRVAPYRHPLPLQDAQRALRLVRAHADEWRVDPARLGILGFSAGGHLASTTGTHFNSGNPDIADPVERLSCRPDFMVLIYPVITFKPPFGHAGSGQNLLGADPDPALMSLLSNDEQVSKDTPPAFLVASSEDTGVPMENSMQFYMALRHAGVPAEIHVFAFGPHGFGMGKGDPALTAWPQLCINWMGKMGFIK